MIYTVGMQNNPIRKVSPDIGDILAVVLPDGDRRYFRVLAGRSEMCIKDCPMSRMDVLATDKRSKWNICGYADFACYSKTLGYHWEEIPIEAIMEEII